MQKYHKLQSYEYMHSFMEKSFKFTKLDFL